VIGYTVRAFRERLGVGGVRELIEHRPLGPDPEPEPDGEPDDD
jgi:putative ABC transport system ATP-binding protein